MPALLTAALIVFLEGLSFGVVLPVLAAYCRQMGGDASWGGYLFAAAVLPRVLTAPFWGRTSDRLGRRPAMAMMAMGTAGASLLWALCPMLDGSLMSGLGWLMLSRLVYGVFAAQSVLGMAVASDVSTPAKRSAAIGALGAAFGLAFTVGPAIGGWFAETYGFAKVGYLAASFQATSLLVVLAVLKETHRRGPDAASQPGVYVPPRAARALLRGPLVLGLSLVTLLSTVAYSVMFPTIEPYMRDVFEWGTKETAYMLSAFGLAGAIVQGGMIRPAVKRYGEKRVAMLGLLLVAAGLGWMAATPSLYQVFGAMALLAMGTGFSVPAVSGMMSVSVSARDQGAVHGLNQSATSIGRGLGFGISGLLFSVSSTVAYASAAGFAVAAALLLYPVWINPKQYSDEAVMDEVP